MSSVTRVRLWSWSVRQASGTSTTQPPKEDSRGAPLRDGDGCAEGGSRKFPWGGGRGAHAHGNTNRQPGPARPWGPRDRLMATGRGLFSRRSRPSGWREGPLRAGLARRSLRADTLRAGSAEGWAPGLGSLGRNQPSTEPAAPRVPSVLGQPWAGAEGRRRRRRHPRGLPVLSGRLRPGPRAPGGGGKAALPVPGFARKFTGKAGEA